MTDRCRVFLLSDPHLGRDMSGFGERWNDHVERIRENWLASVGVDDIVLVPGDISWRKSPDEARVDLDWLDELPGRHKVLVKGNHDWWWSSAQRVRQVLPDSLVAVDADAHWLEPGLIVAGAKGFVSPVDPYFRAANHKAFTRNLQRANDALTAASRLRRERGPAPVVMLLHYPPFSSDGKPTPFAEAIEQAGVVDHCVFGHFHFAEEWAACPQGPQGGGVSYWLGSSDYLGFKPREVFTV